jgi:hypothetical protein
MWVKIIKWLEITRKAQIKKLPQLLVFIVCGRNILLAGGPAFQGFTFSVVSAPEKTVE